MRMALGGTGTTVVALAASVQLLGFAPVARADQSTAVILRRLEAQIAELQSEVAALKKQAAESRGMGTPAAAVTAQQAPAAVTPQAALAPAGDAALDTTGITLADSAEVGSGNSPPAGQGGQTAGFVLANTYARAGAVRDFSQPGSGLRIGGYGSIRFEQSSADAQPSTFNFRRFVLTVDAPIAPKIRTGFELEFERFRKLELEKTASAEGGGLRVEQEVEGVDGSEIAIEQAWVQYDFDNWLRMRAGGVLVPLGRFNLNHDDDRWDIARRPLIDRGSPVLAATAAWAELGVGFNGDVELGDTAALGYQFYVVNGATLSPQVESVVQTLDPKRDKLELEAKFQID